MGRLLPVVACCLALAGCQSLAEASGSKSLLAHVPAEAAAAIAGDMANRLSERLSPGPIELPARTPEFGQALEVALEASGYTVVNGATPGTRATDLSYWLDASDEGVLASLSTRGLRLARLYAVTGSGAIPASPLSVMTFD